VRRAALAAEVVACAHAYGGMNCTSPLAKNGEPCLFYEKACCCFKSCFAAVAKVIMYI
jgi:hypothetical protein